MNERITWAGFWAICAIIVLIVALGAPGNNFDLAAEQTWEIQFPTGEALIWMVLAGAFALLACKEVSRFG